MPSRVVATPDAVIWGSNIAFDCADSRRVAAFWRVALQYDMPEPTAEEHERSLVEHPEWTGLAVVDEDVHRHPRLFLQNVPEPKVERNRVRPVIAVTDVDRLGDIAADVEGNELRIVEGDVTRFVTIEIDAVDPVGQAELWAEMLGLERDGTSVVPSPDWLRWVSLMPSYTFVPETSPKTRKNRLHFDFACRPGEGDRERLLALGCRQIHDGGHFATLQDPEGNEIDVGIG
jgi:hypothetical protein